jgi:hypothetical protein
MSRSRIPKSMAALRAFQRRRTAAYLAHGFDYHPVLPKGLRLETRVTNDGLWSRQVTKQVWIDAQGREWHDPRGCVSNIRELIADPEGDGRGGWRVRSPSGWRSLDRDTSGRWWSIGPMGDRRPSDAPPSETSWVETESID